MSDVALQAPADSSAATQTLEVPTGEGYTEWRQTGRLPTAKPAPAEPKTPEKSAPPASEKSAPAPEAGNNQEQKKPRSNADSRLTELLNDLRDAGLTPAQLKTFKQDYQRVQQQQQGDKQDQAKPPATSEQTDKPAGQERPKRPKFPNFADYSTIDEYNAAVKEHDAAMDKYESDVDAFRDRQADQKARDRRAAETLHEKMQAASKRYGDTAIDTIRETARAISGDQQIAGPVKAMIEQSPVMTDLLYVMGSKPEDLAALVETARTDPGSAIRKIVLLEQLVQAELRKGTPSDAPNGGDDGEPAARGEDGKFTGKKPAPETKVSKAPDPPAEVAGRGSTPPDEVQGALKDNDFARFRAAGNRRDFDQRRGR